MEIPPPPGADTFFYFSIHALAGRSSHDLEDLDSSIHAIRKGRASDLRHQRSSSSSTNVRDNLKDKDKEYENVCQTTTAAFYA